MACMAVAALAGCALPRGAAIESEILSGAENSDAQFEVREVTREFVGVFADWPSVGKSGLGWIHRQRGPAMQYIKAGDRINLSIWDNEGNSLLSAPGQKVVQIQDVMVDPDGSVFLPYVNRIVVSGMSPDEARMAIENELIRIIPSAQVQIHTVAGRRNAVDIVGGVANPGSYPVPDGDYTLQNLIAASGGISSDLRNPQVRLTRDDRLYGIAASKLFAAPRYDTTLRGGDKVLIEADDRFFVALGASDAESVVYFDRERITALEALSMTGGLDDGRADPGGILILREYPKSALRPGRPGPDKNRVVFVVNLTTADGVFSAGQFEIAAGDIVMATESPVTSVQTVLGILGSSLSVSNRLGL